jgi:hypothetical protein
LELPANINHCIDSAQSLEFLKIIIMKDDTISSKDIILDIGSMQTMAKQLVGKGKPYEPILVELLKTDYYYEDDLPLPSMKELSQITGIKYDKTRKLLRDLYFDIIYPEESGINFSVNKVEYHLNLSYFNSRHYAIINHLAIVPRVGENIRIPYFKAKVGTTSFYVRSIEHQFEDINRLFISD